MFAQPALSEALFLAEANQKALDSTRISLQGRTLRQLREWSRREILKSARDYTEKLTGRACDDFNDSALLFATGHQPELYHPGVWIKNFAVSEWAKRSNGLGLNIVIDNDTLGQREISVPTGRRSHPEVTNIAFDQDVPSCPWEEAHLADADDFQRFLKRVSEVMDAWNVDPLLNEFWPTEPIRSGQGLRDVLTASRMQLERNWGAGNLELPLSTVCETDPFLWFTGWVLADPERFRQIHNQALQEFRKVNRVRSGTRPVPDLVQNGDWIESPFWVWRAGDAQRSRVFARQEGRETILSDGDTEFARFPLDRSMDACCAVEALRELPKQGIRLRTRALTTTLFARLCLSDLFVHGIGGAKYDEVTDCLIARLLGITAPKFMTLSCTLHLPLGEPFDVTESELTQLRETQRDLQWNPERWLDGSVDPEVGQLITRKRQLIQEHNHRQAAVGSDRQLIRRENRERHRELRSVSDKLKQWTQLQNERIASDIEATEAELSANKILKSREFPFVLYPAEMLRDFLTSTVSSDC
ncbi:hypothetical protein [Thalassoroseus pseudoceratinae]|uniref:hypothetical protein n=1 Tax=Thalassoroseus pseudoceratinae TaxID=2713176 RepID=UPI001422EF65|nr:hypothetical protein [Thalassoroseus pseudoceratinae]